MQPSEIISVDSHSFNTGIAEELGIHAAIIYNHILYWIKQNARKKDAEMIEGKYWMYETQQQMADFLRYITFDEIKKAVVKLLDAGLLIKGNFNKNKFDRTAWYTVHDQNIIQKTLTKAPYGSMDKMESAPSERAVRHDVYIHKKQQEEQQDITPPPTSSKSEKNGGGGEKYSFSLIYKNTKGEAKQVLESEIYSHFVRLPYETSEIQQAIEEVKQSNDFIGNIFKYLEAICHRIHNSQPKTKIEKHKKECKVPMSTAPTIKFGEYMKNKKHEKENKNETN